MYLKDLRASLARRWYLVVAGLLLTGLLGLATLKLVPATYEANASDVLLPPQSSVIEGGNPFLYLGGLSQALDVLTRSLQSDATQSVIADLHPDIEYTIAPDRTTTGPILLITTDSSSPSEAMAGLQSVLGQIQPTLSKLQDDLNVPQNSRITVMRLAIDAEPTTVRKNQTRAVLAVVALGLVATVLLIGLIDGLLLSRRAKREGSEKDRSSVAPTGHDSGPSLRAGSSLGQRRRPTTTNATERASRGTKADQRTP